LKQFQEKKAEGYVIYITCFYRYMRELLHYCRLLLR
jgi:hypothetical protein